MIKRYVEPDRGLWKNLCLRALADDEIIEGRVKSIIERVRCAGVTIKTL